MTPEERREIVAELREKLATWGTRKTTYYADGGSFTRWVPLPLDEMSDEEVVEAARRIGEGP